MDEPLLTKTAVLKAIDGLGLSVTNAAIESMLELVDGTDEKQPVTIRREIVPVTEWDQNGCMIAAAFPSVFMRGGKSLPQGTWPTPFIRHLMLHYDGRFEKKCVLVATLFNQLQRHTAIRRAARVGTTRAPVLERLGNLANSENFRSVLAKAKIDPSSSQAKRVNAYLLRIMSLIGGSVPFSSFERATTRPKLGAMRARYGVPQHWVTVAPPEHHDLELHRISMIRMNKGWNRTTTIYQRKECTFHDLPEGVRSGARGMLSVSNMYPALAARVFERQVQHVLNDIVLCKAACDTRISRDYALRKSGAYGTIAGLIGVVEPQVDGRLHIHMSLYGSTYSPELLSRIMCSLPLRDRAAKWLESVRCTCFDANVHQWRANCLLKDTALPKSFEIELPRVSSARSYDQFRVAAQMRTAVTNFHKHTSTCFKDKRGKYMCRLARPAGVHDQPTCPLIIIRERAGNMNSGVIPIVVGHHLPSHVFNVIDNGYAPKHGEAFRTHIEGHLLWELKRPATDNLVVETNLVLAALTASHTNSSIINGEDSGDMIDQYQQAYMTKDDVALKGAASALLSAIEHNIKFPSVANDSGSTLRTGKYLASRTVNAFSGAHEWSLPLMVHAITGHRSFVSSDSFWYISPRSFAEYVKDLKGGPIAPSRVLHSAFTINDEESVEAELAELIELANVEDTSKNNLNYHRPGVRKFIVRGKIVFLTQADLYYHRGHNFLDYSPMEFGCIVDILPIKHESAIGKSKRGRRTRVGFVFASTHPFFETHHGVLRAKLMTPILGGAPLPTWTNAASNTRDVKKRDKLANYLLCTFTRWGERGPHWPLDAGGLLTLFDSWDRSDASFIDRQRCRHIKNTMKKGYHNSRNEQVATDWRNRGVDYWKTCTPSPSTNPKSNATSNHDPEFAGSLSKNVDIYELLTRVTAGSPTRRADIASIKEMFSSIILANGNSMEDANAVPTRVELSGSIYPAATDLNGRGTWPTSRLL